MKAALNITLTFDQILELVRQLPRKDKIRLGKELEKEFIGSKLNELLKSMKTDALSEAEIMQETELIREEIYGRGKGS